MKVTPEAQRGRGRWGQKPLAVLALLTLWAPGLWAGEVGLGLLAVVGRGGASGATASFSGVASQGVWLVGGYGSGLWSPSISFAGGGALVGVRPLPAVTLVAKAGLGAGFYNGDAGATRQGGVEVNLDGWGNLVFAASWERVWNFAELPTLPSAGQDVWGLGVRLRFFTQ